jgi:tRNA(Ile2)-agmatinylcytidine synthase
MTPLHIAFDDTDSRLGRCTTHLAYRVTKELTKTLGGELVDHPLLIRLNPNIPWKTRGNGAVCLRAKVRDSDRVIDYVRQAVEEGSAIGSGANPGVAFLKEEAVPEKLKRFSSFAMWDVSSRQQAEKVARECGIKFWTFGNGQGLVGSLGAMGCMLDHDHTFELIAYRTPKNCGTPRIINDDSIIKFSKETFPHTFNNYDQNHGRILIAPHGPDPVFFGVRGESPEIVLSAMSKISPEEKLEGYMVFRSNQGTNMHLQNELDLRMAKAYTAGYVRCRVKSRPHTIEGGHVIFSVEQSGSEMPAAIYEPTGLAKIAAALAPGDLIEIGVGVRKGTTLHPKILNIEYLQVNELAPIYNVANPLCRMCGRRMKSEGKNKGYQCEKCKFRDQKAQKIITVKERALKPGLYLPTAKAHRHLTKPMHRYGMEKNGFQYVK